MTTTTKRNLVDLVERAVATFAQAFLALALVTGLSDRKSAEAAGVAGALAVGKWIYSRVNAYLAPTPIAVVIPTPEAPAVTEAPEPTSAG